MLKEALLAEATRLWHHYPKYPGEKAGLEPVPYLRLPFRQEDLAHYQIRLSQPGIGKRETYSVSEGWYYSKAIKKALRKIVPTGHAAVDYALPYGFPVAAPCEGFAMSSYYSYPLVDKRGNVKVKDGIHQRFGIGYFVQIYNPTRDRFVQLGHLSNIATDIPFSVPVREGTKWIATGHTLTAEQMSTDNPQVAWVNTGDLVGFVGTSGLNDKEDYKEGYDRPFVIDPMSNPSWSIAHIHLDEFMRNYVTMAKDWRRDPYDIYKQEQYYPTHTNHNSMGREPLFLTDVSDRPLFADS